MLAIWLGQREITQQSFKQKRLSSQLCVIYRVQYSLRLSASTGGPGAHALRQGRQCLSSFCKSKEGKVKEDLFSTGRLAVELLSQLEHIILLHALLGLLFWHEKRADQQFIAPDLLDSLRWRVLIKASQLSLQLHLFLKSLQEIRWLLLMSGF